MNFGHAWEITKDVCHLGDLSNRCFHLLGYATAPPCVRTKLPVVLVESKTWTYHWGVGTERTAGWQGGVGQDWMQTELFAKETSPSRTL